jgi:hypothetical protein
MGASCPARWRGGVFDLIHVFHSSRAAISFVQGRRPARTTHTVLDPIFSDATF